MNVLMQAVDSCPSAFLVINHRGIIIEANKATVDIFGYDNKSLIGLEVEELIPSVLRSRHRDHVKKFFERPENKKMDGGRVLEGRNKDGSRLHVEVGINFFKQDEDFFAVANIVDVTREYKMRKLIDRTQEVARIGSWHVDLRLNKCLWSKVTYKIHELDEKQEINVEDGINFYVKEHQPIMRKCVEDGIKKQKSWDVELKIVTTTGKEKWVHAIGSPIVEEGEVVGLEGTFQDIHEQKTSEEKMKSLAHRLTLALEASNVGIWEWNLETNELIWDKQMYKLYGINEQVFEGAYLAWEKGLHPDDKERAVESIQEAIKNETKFDTEFRVVWPDGTVRFVRALASLDYNYKKEPVRMIGVNWDISQVKKSESELKKINESLERANNELIQFSYRSSHDLKAPLIAIRGLAEVILEDLDDNMIDEVKKNVGTIKSQASNLEALVKDLLDLARADISDDKGVVIDFEEIISEVFALNGAIANVNNVEMVREIEVESDWVFVRARVLQILNNLVSNGIKYCDLLKGSRYVNVKIKERSNSLELVVEDNGIGIPYKDKKEVFQMFKRFHSNNIMGSGLGMYVLKKHLDILGGTIDFESSQQGTTFTITLPRL